MRARLVEGWAGLLRGRRCRALDVFEREAEARSKPADDQVEGASGSEVVLGAGDVLDAAAPPAYHQAVAALAVAASRARLQDQRAAAQVGEVRIEGALFLLAGAGERVAQARKVTGGCLRIADPRFQDLAHRARLPLGLRAGIALLCELAQRPGTLGFRQVPGDQRGRAAVPVGKLALGMPASAAASRSG